MRRVFISSIFMFVGMVLALIFASDNSVLAVFMGAVIGLIASVVVYSFPRDRDYQHNNSGDFFSKD
jgi:ABC-type iron transport system FetAB permease component